MLCLHPPPPRVQTPQCRADDPTAFVAWGGGGGQPQKCPVLRPVQASTSLIWSSTVRWGPSVQSLRRPAGSMAGTALSIARLEGRFPNRPSANRPDTVWRRDFQPPTMISELMPAFSPRGHRVPVHLTPTPQDRLGACLDEGASGDDGARSRCSARCDFCEVGNPLILPHQ